MWSAVPHTLPACLFIPVEQFGRVALRAAGATAQERERPAGLLEEDGGHGVEEVLLHRHLVVVDADFGDGVPHGSDRAGRGASSRTRRVVQLLGPEADAQPHLGLVPVATRETHRLPFGQVDEVGHVRRLALPDIGIPLARRREALADRRHDHLGTPVAAVDQVADGLHEETLPHLNGPLEVVGRAGAVRVAGVPQIPRPQGHALKEARERPVVRLPPRVDRSTPNIRHLVPERLPVEVGRGSPIVTPRVVAVAVTLRVLQRALRHVAVAFHAQASHLNDTVSHVIHA